MQPATLDVRTIGVMHKQEWQKCLILWYLHDTEQHLACCPKQRQVVGSIIFVKLIFGSEHKLRLQWMNQDPRDYVKSTTSVNSVFNTSRHKSASLASSPKSKNDFHLVLLLWRHQLNLVSMLFKFFHPSLAVKIHQCWSNANGYPRSGHCKVQI